jgi:hypothetical protein
MERSTPINHLQRGGQAEEMVDDIVDDLEEEQRYLAQQQQPQQPQQHQPQHPQQHQPHHPQQHQPPQHFQGPPEQMYRPPNHQPMMMRPQRPVNQQSLENAPLSQRVLSEAKEPLLVSVLVIIMSSPQLQSLIARFLPIAASNPLIGLAVRAVFAGVLFWLLRRFIPSQ